MPNAARRCSPSGMGSLSHRCPLLSAPEVGIIPWSLVWLLTLLSQVRPGILGLWARLVLGVEVVRGVSGVARRCLPERGPPCCPQGPRHPQTRVQQWHVTGTETFPPAEDGDEAFKT